jgi:hypothetical protein
VTSLNSQAFTHGRGHNMSGGLVGPELFAEIRQTILAVRGGRYVSTESDLSANTAAPGRFPDHAVILDADLDAATHALTGATSCLATVCQWNNSTGKYKETSQQITVWNHDEATNHAADTFGLAKFQNGHYWFLGDCEPMAVREVPE